jgi:hypothetical protein
MPASLIVQPPFSPSFKNDKLPPATSAEEIRPFARSKINNKTTEAVALSRADLRLDQSQKL